MKLWTDEENDKLNEKVERIREEFIIVSNLGSKADIISAMMNIDSLLIFLFEREKRILKEVEEEQEVKTSELQETISYQSEETLTLEKEKESLQQKIERLREESKWINVSDRLPEGDKDSYIPCLVMVRNKGVLQGFFRVPSREFVVPYIHSKKVTHWRLLPKEPNL